MFGEKMVTLLKVLAGRMVRMFRCKSEFSDWVRQGRSDSLVNPKTKSGLYSFTKDVQIPGDVLSIA